MHLRVYRQIEARGADRTGVSRMTDGENVTSVDDQGAGRVRPLDQRKNAAMMRFLRSASQPDRIRFLLLLLAILLADVVYLSVVH
jgi:hypothetical protein